MAATASESRLEERCGNYVFFDNVLERSYNDYGYRADGTYHYNISESYYDISPYVWCAAKPIRLVDGYGEQPFLCPLFEHL